MLTRTWILLGVTLVVACGSADTGDELRGDGDQPGAPGAPGAEQPGAGTPATPGEATPGTSPPPSQPPAPRSTVQCAAGRAGTAGDRTITVTVGGAQRTAVLHVPQSYDPLKGTSLVLAFHGYGGTATQMRAQAGLEAEADKRGFIVVHAEGTGLAQKGFNGGDCCGRPAWTEETDDIGFAREITKTIATDYCIDAKCVYSAGFSNGGFMSYRFVCEAADVFAAVGSVSGVLGTPPEACTPKRAVPIIHVHGTADTTVPFNGGAPAGGLGALVNINFRSVADTVSTFRTKFTCAATSKLVSEKGDTKCEEWTGCQGGARVELCTVTDGGHQWPGGQPTPVGGKTSTDFVATGAILDFFAAHVMP